MLKAFRSYPIIKNEQKIGGFGGILGGWGGIFFLEQYAKRIVITHYQVFILYPWLFKRRYATNSKSKLYSNVLVEIGVHVFVRRAMAL